MSGGKRTRFYTIEFYDIETGASEYASFSQKQLIRYLTQTFSLDIFLTKQDFEFLIPSTLSGGSSTVIWTKDSLVFF